MKALFMNQVVRSGTLSVDAQCCLHDDGPSPSRRSNHGTVSIVCSIQLRVAPRILWELSPSLNLAVLVRARRIRHHEWTTTRRALRIAAIAQESGIHAGRSGHISFGNRSEYRDLLCGEQGLTRIHALPARRSFDDGLGAKPGSQSAAISHFRWRVY